MSVNGFIKYSRIVKDISLDDIQEFFDELIHQGWEIINYSETQSTENENYIIITVLVGKPRTIIN